MGYYSQVALIVQKDEEEELDKILKSVDLEKCFQKNNGDFWDYNHERKEFYVVYIADWLKWYPDFKDVSTVIKFMGENEEERHMVAVGEDGHVHSEGGDWTAYVERTCYLTPLT